MLQVSPGQALGLGGMAAVSATTSPASGGQPGCGRSTGDNGDSQSLPTSTSAKPRQHLLPMGSAAGTAAWRQGQAGEHGQGTR